MKIKLCLLRRLTTVLFLLCFAPAVQGATIDVMIVYDTTASTWVAGHGGIDAFAVDAVAQMNQAAANSGIDLTFRLVHKAAVSYTYGGSLSTALSNLRNGTGNLSVVHQWRNTYGADLVALLVDTGSASGIVGTGYLLTTYSGQPSWAFTAAAIRSVDISHTLTHEVGHNLGCQHSKFQAPSLDPGPNTELNTYSAGWYFTGTDNTKYHTIMAYNSDGFGNRYEEAPLFSTPLKDYQGTTAGNALDGDNARNIRGTMDIVAAYRAAGTCAYLISPYADGFASSSALGSANVTPSSSGCSWEAASNAAWISVIAGQTGTGSGTVAYRVAANTGGSHRIGTITIGGQTFTVRQARSIFLDDPNNPSYSPYIYSIYAAGITVGCDKNGNYCPSNQVTRGQMAAFIIRAKYGETFAYTPTPYYWDVPPTNDFFKYVQKMRDDGLTVLNGTYFVNDIVNREQMAAFIIRARYGETFDYTPTAHFSDVPSTAITFFRYVQKMKDAGITVLSGAYLPKEAVPRDQMAAFLGRAFLDMQ